MQKGETYLRAGECVGRVNLVIVEVVEVGVAGTVRLVEDFAPPARFVFECEHDRYRFVTGTNASGKNKEKGSELHHGDREYQCNNKCSRLFNDFFLANRFFL